MDQLGLSGQEASSTTRSRCGGNVHTLVCGPAPSSPGAGPRDSFLEATLRQGDEQYLGAAERPKSHTPHGAMESNLRSPAPHP